MIERFYFGSRTLIPWTRKINPIWWFKNDEEPDPPGDYLPMRPEWWRQIMWTVRNPIHNFVQYVVGVCDRNYYVVGNHPVWNSQLSDVGLTGWKWSFVLVAIPLPYVSYSGTSLIFNLGWQPSGRFALKLKVHRS